MREMGEEGSLTSTPNLPARVGPKPPVRCTSELAAEMVARFSAGETLGVICQDDRYPTRQAFHRFVSSDAGLSADWEAAKASHAEALMDEIGPIVDREVKDATGRHDTGAVQRDRLRAEMRH